MRPYLIDGVRIGFRIAAQLRPHAPKGGEEKDWIQGEILTELAGSMPWDKAEQIAILLAERIAAHPPATDARVGRAIKILKDLSKPHSRCWICDGGETIYEEAMEALRELESK